MNTQNASTKKLFLSYSRRDIRTAQTVIQQLEVHGFSVWYDGLLHTGEDWPEKVNEAIHTCDAQVILFTEASRQSFYCKAEWLHASEIHKPIYVILDEGGPSLPLMLTSSHAYVVHFETAGFSKEIGTLAEDIQSGRGTRLVDPLLTPQGRPTVFPKFFNQHKPEYQPYFQKARHIYMVSSSGHGLLKDAENVFRDKLLFDAEKSSLRFRFIFPYPTENALRHIAYWSQWRWTQGGIGFAYSEIRAGLIRTVDIIKRFTMLQAAPDVIEIKLLYRFAPAPMVLFDPDDASNGMISVGIYSYGPSIITESPVRPGTLLTREASAGLYDHFHQVWNNMWNTARPTTCEELSNLLTAIPDRYRGEDELSPWE